MENEERVLLTLDEAMGTEILEHIDRFEDARRRRGRYVDLLRKAERERQTVQERIYERVRSEYEATRETLAAECERVEQILQEHLQRFLEERRGILDRQQATSDALEETVFRVRVGEFSEQEKAEEIRDLSERLQNGTEAISRLEQILERYAQAGLLGDEDAAGSEQADRTEDAPREAETAGTEADEEPEAKPETVPDPFGSPEAVMAGLTRPDATREAETEASPEPPLADPGGFVVLEDGGLEPGEDCPVVHCLDSETGETAGQPSDPVRNPSTQDPSRGFVTGYLVAMEGSRQGDRFPLICSDITLGNSPGIDIRLDDSGVNSFHARVLYKDRRHFLENVDPMCRSFVNGVQADLVELKEGDVVRLGDIKLQVEYAPATEAG